MRRRMLSLALLLALPSSVDSHTGYKFDLETSCLTHMCKIVRAHEIVGQYDL